MQTTDTIHEKCIDPRTMRAATESMTTVLEAPGLIRVYSGTNADYLVDIVEGVCECDDYRYNEPENGCKHIARVELELGEREIPDLPGKSDVELMVRARRNDVWSKAMADGGMI